jgi:hypothetical protein
MRRWLRCLTLQRASAVNDLVVEVGGEFVGA